MRLPSETLSPSHLLLATTALEGALDVRWAVPTSRSYVMVFSEKST